MSSFELCDNFFIFSAGKTYQKISPDSYSSFSLLVSQYLFSLNLFFFCMELFSFVPSTFEFYLGMGREWEGTHGKPHDLLCCGSVCVFIYIIYIFPAANL